MSKNIIYSIWSDLTEEHESVSDYKKESFKNLKLHMIGRLQTNKVKYAVQIFDYIHLIF